MEIFVWKDHTDPARWNIYCPATAEETARDIEQIPAQEIRAAAATLTPGADPVKDVAQLFGLHRVTQRARERLNSVTVSSPPTATHDEAAEENGRRQRQPY